MSQTPGRIIRTALAGLFFGTILLGALSFVFYFNKQEQARQRSIRYAAGLRRELNTADLERHERIIQEAFAKPAADRNRTLATYLDSTLGPENMGYTVRSVADKADPEAPAVALDVEVTGSKRPSDIVLVLCGYLPDLSTIDQSSLSKPLAVMLGVAHSMTSSEINRSVRFVALQNAKALPAYYNDAVSNVDRISHVFLLGNLASETDEAVAAALHLEGRGVVFLRPEIKGDLLSAATQQRAALLAQADRL